MAQPQSFWVRALVGVVTFVGRDIIAPPLAAGARGLGEATQSLVRVLAPWVIGFLGLLLFLRFFGKEQTEKLVAALAAYGFIVFLLVTWLRGMKGGKKR